MTSFAVSIAKRALRPVAVACVFAFTGLWPAATQGQAADEAVILQCPACGREAQGDARFCPACGAGLRKSGGDDAPAPDAGAAADSGAGGEESSAPSAAVSSGAKAAAADVAEARKRGAGKEKAAALLLLRNAQTLLAAKTDGEIPAKSARTLASELEQAKADFDASVPPSRRSQALASAARSLEDYFRGQGRVPMGRAWVPSDWPGALTPDVIALVRVSLPLPCALCRGSGAVQCRTCGGSGHVPCKATGCKNGFVFVKPRNSLAPKSDLTVKERCPVCGGRAAVSCKACGGKGATTCRSCGGEGLAPSCNSCGGTGLVVCRDCLQKGVRPDCPACKGTGNKLCGKCGGDGRTPR